VAAAQGSVGADRWTVTGMTRAAQDLIIDYNAMLTKDRVFPGASQAVTDVSWLFSKVDGDRRGWRLPPRAGDFVLELQDVPGRLYADRFGGGGTDQIREEVIEHLAASRGLVYLFDPVIEQDEGDSFSYLHGVLQRLSGKLRERPGFKGGQLPHFVAVCMTKFDDPRFYDRAYRGGWVDRDPQRPYFPRVADHVAEAVFDAFCRESPQGSANHVRDFLSTYFRKSRVKYFVVSSVGFRVAADGRFDPNDYANVNSVNGEAVILGRIHPINVLESLVRLAGAARTGSW
jgi:hypothetical protein